MGIINIIIYIISFIIFYLSIKISFGNGFDISMMWDLSSILFILSGFVISIANFKLSEIFGVVKSFFSKKEIHLEDLERNFLIVKTIWGKTITMANLSLLIASVILFSYITDTRKIGPILAILILSYVYALIIRIFILYPLEVSIEKRKILIKNN